MNSIRERIPQTCIVVLGMHRSGTSALTGVLSLLGIHPGESLLPAMEDVNPKGFWEHAEVVAIHNELLEAFDSSWHDEAPLPGEWWKLPAATACRSRIVDVLRRDFGNRAIWLIKDPRMCRLLPLWQDIFRDLACQPRFILMLRNPAEVAHSLRKRDDMPDISSCLLWLTHMLEAEYRTRGLPRAFVNYEDLLSDWRGTTTDIAQTLGLTWPVAIEDAAPSIETFLDPSLRHHASDTVLPEDPASRLARKGFELLSSPALNAEELDRLRNQTEEFVGIVAPLSKLLWHNKGLIPQNHRLESENAALHSEIKRIKGTLSWRITKPLRWPVWNTLLRFRPRRTHE